MKIPALVMVEVAKVAPASLKIGDRIVYGDQAVRFDGEVSIDHPRRAMRLVSETTGVPMIVPMTPEQWAQAWVNWIV